MTDVIVVRDGDYYGGDLEVEVSESKWETDNVIVVRWLPWGRYGLSEISLLSVDEARKLAAALMDAAQLREVIEAGGEKVS